MLQNIINGLRADTLGLEQEKQNLALMVKEYEAMQEENTSSVLEELEESKKRTKALKEILDDVECEGNTLHSKIAKKRGISAPKKEPAFQIDFRSSSDANKETRTNPKSLTTPKFYEAISTSSPPPSLKPTHD